MPSWERLYIAGFPSHWLEAVKPSGLFSSPRNDIIDAVIEGSATGGASPDFDTHEELEKLGLDEFRDSISVSWFKGARVKIHFSRFRDENGPAPNLEQLAKMLSVGSLIHDGTIQRVCVQDGIDGPMFLWTMFPRRKIRSTGAYDNWGKTIDDYNHAKLRRHRAVASLDLVAYSEDEEWLFDRSLIETAIMDAYRMDRYKPALQKLVIGTDAFDLLQKRIEPAAPVLAPVIVSPLFG